MTQLGSTRAAEAADLDPGDPHEPDPALVLAARLGDGEAFGQIYDLLGPQVERFLTGLRLPAAELEDALQDTFLRLLQGLPARYQPGRSLRAWAFGIAYRVAMDHFRRRPQPPVVSDPPARSAGPAERLVQCELDEQIDAALAALPAEARTVLVLRHLNRVTMAELSEALECSVPTARTRLRGAAAAFARELAHRGVLPASPGTDSEAGS